MSYYRDGANYDRRDRQRNEMDRLNDAIENWTLRKGERGRSRNRYDDLEVRDKPARRERGRSRFRDEGDSDDFRRHRSPRYSDDDTSGRVRERRRFWSGDRGMEDYGSGRDRDRRNRDRDQTDRDRRDRDREPEREIFQKKVRNLPRGLTYEGKSNWDAFSNKFHKYASASSWTGAECKDNLCWCLEGKASEYYTTLIDTDPELDFYDLMKRLERRFGFKELAETAMITFTNARQKPEEPLEEWADRVMNLATKAFRGLPEHYMYKQTIMKFCLGCADKEAGETVANNLPTSMEDALDKMKWAMHTRTAVYGRRREVREVTKDRDEDMKVCAVSEDKWLVKKLESELHVMTEELKGIKRDMRSLQSQNVILQNHRTAQQSVIVKLENRLDQLENNMMQPSHTPYPPRPQPNMQHAPPDQLPNTTMLPPPRPSPNMRNVSPRRRSASTSPARVVECFRCKGNHYIRDCPVPDNRTVSFVDTADGHGLLHDLNDSESGQEA